MGLGGAHRLGDTLKTSSKDFDLVIRGGLCWIKLLKNGAEKGFIFHAVIPVLYPF